MSIKHLTAAGARAKLRPARLLGALMVVLMALTWWFWFRPEALGGSVTLVTVDGVSMEPGMHTGDLAVVRKTGDYAAGDVIAFRVAHEDGQPGAVVIHRIVDGDAEYGFRMRGDNNDWDDPWQPTAGDIVGELWFHLPGAGQVVRSLADPLLAAAFFAALTAFGVIAGDKRDGKAARKEAP